MPTPVSRGPDRRRLAQRSPLPAEGPCRSAEAISRPQGPRDPAGLLAARCADWGVGSPGTGGQEAGLRRAGTALRREPRAPARALRGPGSGAAAAGLGPLPGRARIPFPQRRPGPAASRRPAHSRVAAAADGHRPVVHLQADRAAVLRLQAAVTARRPARRLPLLSRGHQAAEHRHPGAGPAAAAALFRPGRASSQLHGRDGAALTSSGQRPAPAPLVTAAAPPSLVRAPPPAGRAQPGRRPADVIRTRLRVAAAHCSATPRSHVPGWRGLRGPRARGTAATAAWVRPGRPHPPLFPGAAVGPGRGAREARGRPRPAPRVLASPVGSARVAGGEHPGKGPSARRPLQFLPPVRLSAVGPLWRPRHFSLPDPHSKRWCVRPALERLRGGLYVLP